MPNTNQNYLQETILTLTDAEAFIARLEKKHGVSTADFLKDPGVRASIPEDDAFEWDAYLDHRAELRQINEETREKYLSELSRSSVRENQKGSLLSLAA